MKCPVLQAVMVTALFAMRADAGFMARIEFFPTDLNGVPIDTISIDDELLLQVVVQDIREPVPTHAGVFAAYVNLEYESQLVRLGISSNFGPFFDFGRQHGEWPMPGVIEGLGAWTTSSAAPGNEPQLLFQFTVTAIHSGEADFTPSYASGDEEFVALFGYDNALLDSEIQFVGSTLNVVPEPSSIALLVTAGSFLAAVGFGPRRARPA